MTGSEDPSISAARQLLTRFLANRPERTRQAYTTDVEDFARFLKEAPDAAVAHLLGDGPDAGERVVLDYAVHLRQRGRATATISRRLGTLRALTRAAHDLRIVGWLLDMPSPEEISAAIARRSSSDSIHYLLPRHPNEIDRLDIQHF